MALPGSRFRPLRRRLLASILFVLLALVPGLAQLPHSCLTGLHAGSHSDSPRVCRPHSDDDSAAGAEHCLACTLHRTLVAHGTGGAPPVVDTTPPFERPHLEGAESSDEPEGLPPARGPPSVSA